MKWLKTGIVMLGLGLASCGEVEYEVKEGEKSRRVREFADEVEKKAQEPFAFEAWKEEAWSAETSAPRLVLDEEVVNEKEGDWSSCPPRSLCMQAPWISRHQFSLASTELPALSFHQERGVFRVEGVERVFLEADVMNLEGLHLELCAEEEVTVISSEIRGEAARIDLSASTCQRQNGGDLILIAPTLGSLKVQSSGRQGRNGEALSVDDHQLSATDGDPYAVSLHPKWSTQKKNFCIYQKGTRRHRSSCRGASASDIKKNWKRLRNANFSKSDVIQSIEDHLEKEQVSSPLKIAASCELRFRNQSSTTAWVNEVSVSLKGQRRLDGADARQLWPGEPGERGGDSGRLQAFYALQTDESQLNFEAEAGRGGRGSSAVAEKPGRGVKARLDPLHISRPLAAEIRCSWAEKYWTKKKKTRLIGAPDNQRTDTVWVKDKKKWRHHELQSLVARGSLEAEFRLGRKVKYRPAQDRYRGRKLTRPQGQDGDPISKERLQSAQGRDGSDGRSWAPETYALDYKELRDELRNVCTFCSTPKWILQKEYEEQREELL